LNVDGGNKSLRNVGTFVPDYTASNIRIPQLSIKLDGSGMLEKKVLREIPDLTGRMQQECEED
jgi:hypothetical protein